MSTKVVPFLLIASLCGCATPPEVRLALERTQRNLTSTSGWALCEKSDGDSLTFEYADASVTASLVIEKRDLSTLKKRVYAVSLWLALLGGNGSRHLSIEPVEIGQLRIAQIGFPHKLRGQYVRLYFLCIDNLLHKLMVSAETQELLAGNREFSLLSDLYANVRPVEQIDPDDLPQTRGKFLGRFETGQLGTDPNLESTVRP